MRLRNLFGGLGLMGLVTAQEVQATEPNDTGYENLTHGETLQALTKKVEEVTYQSFGEEIKQYDGAAIMLATNTCPSAEGEPINRNQEIIHLQLMDKYANAKVNALPIKFTWFDTCGRSGADLLGIPGLETHMYLDGKLIDVRLGGPIGADGIEPAVKNMTYWINYNLLGITEPGEENIVLLYQGGLKWKEYPRSVLKQ